MDLLEASKDNRNTQRDGPDAVYAPLRPLTYSWEVPRHHHTFEKGISKGDIKILKYKYWHYFQIHFHRFVWLSWFWLNIMAVLADSHSGNEPGRRTTKVFITFVVTPALLSFPLLVSPLHLTPKLMLLNLTRGIWWKNLKQWNSYVIKLLACVTKSGMLLLWWFNFAILIFLTINSVRLTSRWQSLCIIGGYLILDLNCFHFLFSIRLLIFVYFFKDDQNKTFYVLNE